MKLSHTIRPVFDDPNLVSAAGLVPVLRLAEAAGLCEQLDAVEVLSANVAAKASGVVAGMLAGADCIDDLDLLRHGALTRVFGGVRAPSTLGSFLHSFTHGHVQQLDAVGAGLLAGLARRVPGLFAGADAHGIAFIDVDDTIREVHGYAKQGAAYGYTGVRGLNVQLATISTPISAPVIARARLRRGQHRLGQGRWLAPGTVRLDRPRRRGDRSGDGSSGLRVLRVGTRRERDPAPGVVLGDRADDHAVTAAISSLSNDAWTPIKYPKAEFDERLQQWVSDAEVAEVPFTAFTSRRKAEHVSCRLVVRRVKRLQPLASDGTIQGELFTSYRHHAFITNSTLATVEADERHRDHAIIEQVIAELKDVPLAHLPSG